ncbi:MAG TPA: GGDEF domain-containing protein [Pirellulales bacterium]|nr:GGDEF domain-containing protein [Pirellulales bacterium]
MTFKPEAERRLAAALGDSVEIVSIQDDRDPVEVEYDVLVTDLWSDPALHITGRSVRAGDAASCGRAKLTVLGIGQATEDFADLTVSEDYTPREICLACAALGEVARLRNELRRIAKNQHEISLAAETDPLTGLANRRAWEGQLELKCDPAIAAHDPIWLAIVDLDHFKDINDRQGMTAGDRVLAQAAQSLASQLRGADFIARLGGDEFGVLLAGVQERNVTGVFDRLRAAVAGQAVETSAGRLTASIGYAHSNENCSAADLFAAAERGLREAKRAGGNRACRGEVAPSGPGE